MTPERHRQIGELFEAVLDRPSDERAAYLTNICAGDDELRSEVDGLLRHYQETGQFLATLGEESMPPEPAPTIIGPYLIRSQLGEGGMGVVYRAEQSEPFRREVALKIIRPGMGSKRVIARFETERRTLAMMDHPNIAHVFDAGTTEQGLPYFAMELLVESVPLTIYCEHKGLTIPERLRLFIQVCGAIQYAHQKGIIHRDIKPNNVLVREIEGKPIPKVIDFGLAKALDTGISDASMVTNVGQVVGTLNYMSPEQADLGRQDIDTRSDVYSLGVLLYELLTGETPLHVSKSLNAGYLSALERIREEEPVAPSQRSKTSLDRELDWITMKALAKDRGQRFVTVNAMVRDLERYLAGEPVDAAPPSRAYRTRKFVARHRFGLAIGTAVALVLAAAVVVSVWMAVRARTAERAAVEQRERANREAASSQAVNDFLQNDLLAQAGASSQAGRGAKPDPDLKVRTTLERAAAAIAGKFDKQPEVEASIRETIGRTYIDLGQYPEARKQLERAVLLYRGSLGADNPKTLQAVRALGSVAELQGKFPEAESLYAETLAGERRVLGPNAADTLTAMNSLAVVYWDEGKYAQAETTDTQAMAIEQRVLGAQSPTTIGTMNTLAVIYAVQHKFAQAEPLMTKVVEARRNTLGPEHPSTLRSMINLANIYKDEGKPVGAEPLLLGVIDIQRRVLGPEHPNTLGTMNDLGSCYDDDGRFKEAESILRQTVEAERRTLGPEHPDTVLAEGNLAGVYTHLGNYAQAAALRRHAFEVRRRVLGPDHPRTLAAANNLAWVLVADPDVHRRRPAEALQLARASVKTAPSDAWMYTTLGIAEYRNSHWDESIAALNQAVRMEKEPDPADLLFLAMAHWRRGGKAEAAKLFQEGVDATAKDRKDPLEDKEFLAEAAGVLGTPVPGPDR